MAPIFDRESNVSPLLGCVSEKPALASNLSQVAEAQSPSSSALYGENLMGEAKANNLYHRHPSRHYSTLPSILTNPDIS